MKALCLTGLFVAISIIRLCAQTPAKTVPPFSFKKFNNTEFSNKNLEPGKLLFFVFFDTECDHCKHALQYINTNYNDFKKTAIYLITLDSEERLKPFFKSYVPTLKDKSNVTLLQDTKNEFITKFSPRKYPSLFLYSAKKDLMLYDDNERNLYKFAQQIKEHTK